MVGETNNKRLRKDGYKRRHERNKFRKTTNATVRRKDLGNGLKGFLFSCTPRHENHCFRDGVLLLSKFCEDASNKTRTESAKKEDSLEDELSALRSEDGKLFTRVDAGVNGAVFVKIKDDKIDIEHVVESALREARETGNAGSRHCIRMLPIYSTCYAKAEDAAKAVVGVVKKHFPKIDKSPVTYAIAFRSRVNNGAKRDEFITAVASAVEKTEPRYKVNLTKPDIVLLVEVVKTSCCIGVFRHYYELAKMNLREAACPSKQKDCGVQEGSVGKGKQQVTLKVASKVAPTVTSEVTSEVASESAEGGIDRDQETQKDEAPKMNNGVKRGHEMKDCVIQRDSVVKANKTASLEVERNAGATEGDKGLTDGKTDDRLSKGTSGATNGVSNGATKG